MNTADRLERIFTLVREIDALKAGLEEKQIELLAITSVKSAKGARGAKRRGPGRPKKSAGRPPAQSDDEMTALIYKVVKDLGPATGWRVYSGLKANGVRVSFTRVQNFLKALKSDGKIVLKKADVQYGPNDIRKLPAWHVR